MSIHLNPTDKLKDNNVKNFVLFADENYNVFNYGNSHLLKNLKNFTKSINIRLKKKDFLIMLKLVKKDSKIKIF